MKRLPEKNSNEPEKKIVRTERWDCMKFKFLEQSKAVSGMKGEYTE